MQNKISPKKVKISENLNDSLSQKLFFFTSQNFRNSGSNSHTKNYFVTLYLILQGLQVAQAAVTKRWPENQLVIDIVIYLTNSISDILHVSKTSC